MQLMLLSSDDDMIRIQCEGTISQRDFEPDNDPIEALLGADCYCRNVLLNLDRTHYIDSSGVGWLMGRHKHFLKNGGRLVLYAIPPMVSQVLHLLRMSLILHMATDETAARALAAGGKP
jgi:stage II sporulation protein AA (anti-sigma F factor antagonist)